MFGVDKVFDYRGNDFFIGEITHTNEDCDAVEV